MPGTVLGSRDTEGEIQAKFRPYSHEACFFGVVGCGGVRWGGRTGRAVGKTINKMSKIKCKVYRMLVYS